LRRPPDEQVRGFVFCLNLRCCLCLPDSLTRNGTKRKQPADGQGSGAVVKRSEVKRSEPDGVRPVLRRAVCDFQQSKAVAERSQSARRFQPDFSLLRIDLIKTPRHAGCRCVRNFKIVLVPLKVWVISKYFMALARRDKTFAVGLSGSKY